MPTINSEHRNEYALITGATSGIGYELARLFAADGYSLIIVARNADRLQEVADGLKQEFGIEATPIAIDLFNELAPMELYEKVQNLGVVVNVLVNNAGQGEWGPFVTTDLERELDIIRLNIVAPVSLTKLFVRDMVARNEGRILQLSSEAGTVPTPLLAVYAATKAFVLSFSIALSNELKDTNVQITALLPGATDTDFFHKAGQVHSVVYREKDLESPAKVALDGYEALQSGDSKVVSGGKTKLHVFMNDLLGLEMGASNMKKQMMPSTAENGRTASGHAASRQERAEITRNTGRRNGDQ